MTPAEEIQREFFGRRGGVLVKSNIVYRLCNNMVYTFALGSPSIR